MQRKFLIPLSILALTSAPAFAQMAPQGDPAAQPPPDSAQATPPPDTMPPASPEASPPAAPETAPPADPSADNATSPDDASSKAKHHKKKAPSAADEPGTPPRV